MSPNWFATLTCVILLTLTDARAQSWATVTFCLEQPFAEGHLKALTLRGEPVSVIGLEPLIGFPHTAFLQLHTKRAPEGGDRIKTPAGERPISIGPYDREFDRLYVRGWSTYAWVDIKHEADAWFFGESGKVKPRLYFPRDDIDDINPIQRSRALGVQFYSGYTKPHWLTGWQSYRVYELSGSRMTRIPDLERKKLSYLGDDPITGRAAFAPADGPRGAKREYMVWYDGVKVIEATRSETVAAWVCR